jgi:predicted MFS family arabinose efflux permease
VTARGTLGRVTTIMRTVVLSSAALGAAVGGVVAEIAGLRAPMLALAPLLLIAALVARRVKPDE